MRATLIVVPLLLFGLAGCAGDRATDDTADRPGAPASDELPVGRTFVSTRLTRAGGEKPLVSGTTIRLRILAADRISVQAGCNTATGPARVDAGTLVVDDLATTEIGCDEALHQQDEWINGFFRGRPQWRLSGTTLTLAGKDAELTMADSAAAQSAGPPRPLVGTRWTVDTLVSGGVASSAPSDAAAFLVFGPDGKVSGSTGCNSLGGTATIEGNKIDFGQLSTTRRACAGAGGAMEATVLTVLDKPVTYRIEGARLYLEAADGDALQFVG